MGRSAVDVLKCDETYIDRSAIVAISGHPRDPSRTVVTVVSGQQFTVEMPCADVLRMWTGRTSREWRADYRQLVGVLDVLAWEAQRHQVDQGVEVVDQGVGVVGLVHHIGRLMGLPDHVVADVVRDHDLQSGPAEGSTPAADNTSSTTPAEGPTPAADSTSSTTPAEGPTPAADSTSSTTLAEGPTPAADTTSSTTPAETPWPAADTSSTTPAEDPSPAADTSSTTPAETPTPAADQ